MTGTGSVSTSLLVPVAEAAVAEAPSVVPTVTAGKEEAASSAARRRMCRRKEDICSAVEGAVAAGTGSVSTYMLVPAAEAAVAVAPSVTPTATSGEEEAAGVAAVDAAADVASSAAGGAVAGRWEADSLLA